MYYNIQEVIEVKRAMVFKDKEVLTLTRIMQWLKGEESFNNFSEEAKSLVNNICQATPNVVRTHSS